MKGVVADLVPGAHGKNFLARRLKRAAMNVGVGESSGFSLFEIGLRRSQVRDEFLPHRLGDRRSIVLKLRKPGAQGALTCGTHFTSDRVIVSQVEHAQKRPECKSLEHERAEHDGERGQHDQAPKWKSLGQRHCRGKRNDTAHAGPRDDHAAADRRP